MSSAITFQSLRVATKIAISKVLSFEMSVRLNAHAEMEICGIVTGRAKGSVLLNWFGEKIEVVSIDDSKAITRLFCGYIINAKQDYQDGYETITFTARSATWLLDLQRGSRSFQNVALTHEAVMDLVCAESGQADFIMSVPDKAIVKPIIRYDETDWEFFKRMAGYLGASLIPDHLSFTPRFYVGMPSKRFVGEIIHTDYNFGMDKRYFEFAHDELGMQKTQLAYYDVASYSVYETGEKVRFLGREHSVCEKRAKLEKGLLVFTYRLADAAYACARKVYNARIKGISLRGTVLETFEEHLKVHLDIDKSQPVQEAYPYKWKPETGNLMYLMPQVGTKVNLYVPVSDEKSARCVECVRENGEVHPEMIPTDRYLTTEHRMRMRMLPDKLSFLSFNSRSQFEISDAFGETFMSTAILNIKAEEDITLIGKRVFFNAPQEMTVVCRRWDMPTVINLCNDFDLIGKISRFDSNIPPQPDTLLNSEDEGMGAALFSAEGCEGQILAAAPANTGDDGAVNMALNMSLVLE